MGSTARGRQSARSVEAAPGMGSPVWICAQRQTGEVEANAPRAQSTRGLSTVSLTLFDRLRPATWAPEGQTPLVSVLGYGVGEELPFSYSRLCLLGALDGHSPEGLLADGLAVLHDRLGCPGGNASVVLLSVLQADQWVQLITPLMKRSPDSSVMSCTIRTGLAALFSPSTGLGRSASSWLLWELLTMGFTLNFITCML